MTNGLLDLNARVSDVVQSVFGVFLQTPPQKRANSIRCVVRKADPIRLSLDDGYEDVRYGVAGESLPTRESLVEYAAE